jgi:hypothetical protein
MDAYNQRMRMDFNLTQNGQKRFSLIMLDFLNDRAFLMVQAGSGFDCEAGQPDPTENPFRYNHFNNARYRGYMLLNDRVSGLFDQAEFVWPVIGKGQYNYDIFEGHPTRVMGKIDDMGLKVDYFNQTERNLNDELFTLPTHIPCGTRGNKISNKMTNFFK